MAVTKKCKNCGKEFKPCRNLSGANPNFHWRAVTCSPECGERYLHNVLVARGQLVEEAPSEVPVVGEELLEASETEEELDDNE